MFSYVSFEIEWRDGEREKMYGEGYGEEDGEGWTDTKREWGRARKGEKVKEKVRELR